MKYRDYKVGFTVDVPDYFSEVRESSFEVFDVSEDTLKYFIMLDDDGEVVRSFSINKAKEEIREDSDYDRVVEENIKAMEEVGLTLILHEHMTLTNGRKMERIIMCDKEQEEDVAVLFYFTRIKNSLICSSTYIREFFDEAEDELLMIFNSIEEF